jgi:hypothetical protein
VKRAARPQHRPTAQQASAKPSQEVTVFTARRINRPAIACALACALLTTNAALAQGKNHRPIASQRGASPRQNWQPWTPTKTQIRSALAQERYYMSFGRE